MSKTTKPLHIVVDADMLNWPEVQALIAQGHSVVSNPLDQEDIQFGPKCWRMDETLRKYFPVAINQARQAKYPPTKEKKEAV